jgi:hypothetical protein
MRFVETPLVFRAIADPSSVVFSTAAIQAVGASGMLAVVIGAAMWARRVETGLACAAEAVAAAVGVPVGAVVAAAVVVAVVGSAVVGAGLLGWSAVVVADGGAVRACVPLVPEQPASAVTARTAAAPVAILLPMFALPMINPSGV